MTDPDNEKQNGLRPDPRATGTLSIVSIGALVLAILLTAVPLLTSVWRGFDQLVALGVLQPILAAFLSLAIVLGIRLAGGRYVGERRKGGTSASSAAIAVRLWALCFSLLAGAMLLFAAVQHVPEWLQHAPASRSINAEVEVKGAAGSTATKVRVGQ